MSSTTGEQTLSSGPVKKNFTVVVGDSFDLVVTAKETDGSVFPFTGFTGKLNITIDGTEKTYPATFDIVLGQYKVNIAPVTTLADFIAGKWEYGAEWTKSTTDRREFLQGYFVILKERVSS